MSDDPLLLTVSEAAKLLNIGRNTCYELARRREIPVICLGQRSVRIPRHALEDWIRRQVRLAEAPPEVLSFPARQQQH